MTNKVAIGIDLGTTYSCVGVWQNNSVHIIANDQGNYTTPSFVAFTDTERLIGDPAKAQSTSNPLNTIYDAKRLIGRDMSDPVVQQDMKHWSFKVIDKSNKPQFQVQYMGETKTFSPEEISAMVLTKMKQSAEAYLGHPVTDAVVTVPAYFNDSQRQATKDAGTIAGLNVLRIVNEPTAAALAYGLDKISDREVNILIYDNGGGTHDVTLLNMEDGVFSVRATSGNSHLGGEDYDNRLVKYCLQDFHRKYKVEPKDDPETNPRALRRLKTACERAKRVLSSSTSTTIEVDSLAGGIDYRIEISRSKFEQLCRDLFEQTMEPVRQVLLDAKLDKSKVDEIVLVGGSTRIPKIREMLSQYFGGKKLNESVNPDEAVAYGAAIQAAILTGGSDDSILGEMVLLDVTPLSLGIETAGGIMTNIVDRNTTIPVKKTQVFSTYADNQTGVTVQIFEGERKFTRDNNQLGSFELGGIPPAPRGVPQIEVSFDIDANGILNVSARDKSTSKGNNLTITNNKGKFTKEDIARLVEEAKQFEESDNKRKLAVDARNELEHYSYTVRHSMSEEKIDEILDADTRKKIEDVCNEIDSFVLENQSEERDVYESKKKQLEDLWNPIAVKLYSRKSAESGGTGPLPEDLPDFMEPELSNNSTSGPQVDEVD